MQLLIFFLPSQQRGLPLRVVGSNAVYHLVACNQVLLAFFPFTLAGGGLKWTRTIDLTLIRRVL